MSTLADAPAAVKSVVGQMAEQLNTNAKLQQLDNYKVTNSAKGNITTTNWGTRVSNDDDSLKIGGRATLLNDFHLREKVSHFDHERIPERVVHARGAGAHGYFQVYEPLSKYTKAGFLNDTSRKTPVFVRFSTVLGSRGAPDTAREVRGFATRFYTDEGNFDLVGNNIPVFFMQDAIKFPDLVHAGKPEPHNEIPQSQTAHDNFWDWISLLPESTHMALWALSDRTIPKSFRTMEGFGVHSFVLVNEHNERCFVKFHWKPKLGTYSLVWDESQKIAGQDPDFHRRDLWENIENGNYPEWELGLQIIPESDEDSFDFDILDPTKLIPEEKVPVKIVGRLVLNRNPDDFFAETEQVAFCTQHIVPGIDFSNDPLLQGRNFSYLDTQITRIGPNFAELPINRPVCPVLNNQRDGFMRQKISRDRVNYHPNRMDAPKPGDPVQHDAFLEYAEMIAGIKARTRAPKFQEHYNQATLFWNSQSEPEKAHLIAAAQFELGKCDDVGVRERMIDRFNHVDHYLACQVAEAVGITPPAKAARPNHGESSPALSLLNHPGEAGIATRKIAFLVGDGYDPAQTLALRTAFANLGAITVIVGPRKGLLKIATGASGGDKDSLGLSADFSFWTCKSTLFDAVIVCPGSGSVQQLSKIGEVHGFITEAFKHLKPIAAVGDGIQLLQQSFIPSDYKYSENDEVTADRGVVTVGHWDPKTASKLSGAVAGATSEAARGKEALGSLVGAAQDVIKTAAGIDGGHDFVTQFASAIEKHRHWDRDVSMVPCA